MEVGLLRSCQRREKLGQKISGGSNWSQGGMGLRQTSSQECSWKGLPGIESSFERNIFDHWCCVVGNIILAWTIAFELLRRASLTSSSICAHGLPSPPYWTSLMSRLPSRSFITLRCQSLHYLYVERLAMYSNNTGPLYPSVIVMSWPRSLEALSNWTIYNRHAYHRYFNQE